MRPDYRKRGVATLTLRAALNHPRGPRLRRRRRRVARASAMGAPLYEKMGFELSAWSASGSSPRTKIDRARTRARTRTARTRTRTAFARGRPKLWPRRWTPRRSRRGGGTSWRPGAPRVPSCPRVAPGWDSRRRTREARASSSAPRRRRATRFRDGFRDDEADAFSRGSSSARNARRRVALGRAHRRGRVRPGTARGSAAERDERRDGDGAYARSRRAAEALRRAGFEPREATTRMRRSGGGAGGGGRGRRGGADPGEGGAAVDRRELRPRVSARATKTRSTVREGGSFSTHILRTFCRGFKNLDPSGVVNGSVRICRSYSMPGHPRLGVRIVVDAACFARVDPRGDRVRSRVRSRIAPGGSRRRSRSTRGPRRSIGATARPGRARPRVVAPSSIFPSPFFLGIADQSRASRDAHNHS